VMKLVPIMLFPDRVGAQGSVNSGAWPQRDASVGWE